MTNEKVRIINTTTGKVKFVSPLVAADTKGLFDYGFIVQHLPTKELEAKESAKEEVKEPAIQEQEPLDLLSVGSTETTTEAKGKPGRKPNAK